MIGRFAEDDYLLNSSSNMQSLNNNNNNHKKFPRCLSNTPNRREGMGKSEIEKAKKRDECLGTVQIDC